MHRFYIVKHSQGLQGCHEFILSPEIGCLWLTMVPGSTLKWKYNTLFSATSFQVVIHNNSAIEHSAVDKVSLKTRNKEEEE
jgi:hypothetical protein